MKATVKLDTAGLQRKLAALSDQVRGQVAEAALLTGAQRIVNEAKIRAPVRTGTLRRSIQAVIQERGPRTVVAIGTNLDYAYFVEYGTATQPAQPYLRPAFDQERQNAIADIIAALKDALNAA